MIHMDHLIATHPSGNCHQNSLPPPSDNPDLAQSPMWREGASGGPNRSPAPPGATLGTGSLSATFGLVPARATLGDMSLLEPDAVSRLRDAFEEIDYRTDAVLEAIGEAGRRGLERNTTIAAETALAGRDDPLAAAIRMWLLRRPVPAGRLSVLPLDELVAAGIIELDGDRAVGAVDIRPYDSPDDGAGGWVVSDPTPGLNKMVTRTRPDYVLGVSPASTSLAQMTSRRPVGTALDLGCGCGVQSMHLARHSGRVIATDVNTRALQMAELSLALSATTTTGGQCPELREGSLFEPVPEKVDLIVSNPPYVMSPPRPAAERLEYREAGFTADGLIEQVVRRAPACLNPGGTVQILANWAQIGDQPWAERLAGWVEGLGVDMWALEREHLDVHEYIETWLTDAGLDGSDQWRPRYDEWLGYFESLGITGVSMGWLALTAAGREHPDLSFEEWPWSIQQPVGQAIGQRREGVDDALATDEHLLSGRWAVRDDVIAESTGRPGAADPEHLVYRQRSGLCRAMEADTVLGGVLGACDGGLDLGTIDAAVAQILGVDAGAVREQILPQVRRALREGILVRA